MTTPVATPPRLWSRNFSLYFVARIVSMLGDAMIPVAVSIAVLSLGYGVTGVGVVLGAWMGTFALCVVFGGVFADRFHPIPQMIGSDVVRCAVQLGIAAWLWAGHPPLWFLIAGSALGGLATAMFQPGVSSLVPQVAHDPQQANGVLRVSQGLAQMGGPALAGIIVASTSAAWALVVDAATFAVSAVCLAALKLAPFTADRGGSTLADLRAGWQEFSSRAWLWSVILIWMVLGVFVFGPVIPLGAASIVDAHGKAAFGWAEAVFGVGNVVGGLVAIRLRPARPLFAGGVAMLLFPLMPLAAGAVPDFWLLLAGYGCAGAGWAFWSVQWATSVQTQIPPDRLNRVTAYEIAGSVLAVPVGQTIAGPVSALIGVHRMLYLSAVIGLAGALALLVTGPVRRLRRVNPPPLVRAGAEHRPADSGASAAS